MKWLKDLDEKLFRFGSPTTLGLFRIVAGAITFVSLLMVLVDFEAWFTEKGFVPAEFAERWSGGLGRINFLSGVTDERITLAFYLLVTLSALLVTLGLFTRVSSIVLFLGMVTLHHRTTDILHSGDTLERAWLFFLMISPCGAALSLDRWLRVRAGKETGPPPQISIWPQRLVQYQLAVVYFTTAWHKMGGSHWRDGTATWYTLNLQEFFRFPLPPFMMTEPMIKVQTYGTLLVELAMCTLVFSRQLRKWVLLGGLLLHAGIDYSMNIPLFGFIICVGYICFYDGEEIEGWWSRLKTRFRKEDAVPKPKQDEISA